MPNKKLKVKRANKGSKADLRKALCHGIQARRNTKGKIQLESGRTINCNDPIQKKSQRIFRIRVKTPEILTNGPIENNQSKAVNNALKRHRKSQWDMSSAMAQTNRVISPDVRPCCDCSDTIQNILHELNI